MGEAGEAITIIRVAEAEIGANLGKRLQSLLQECFPGYPSRSYFKLPPHFRYLAVTSGGSVVAQMGVEFRVIRVGDNVARTFGVVDLCVTESERSRGLAGRLLAEVTEFARSCGMDFVVLFADDDRLYARNGWARVTNRCSWVRIHDHVTLGIARQEDPGAMMVKAIGEQAWPEGDVDLLGHLFLYEQVVAGGGEDRLAACSRSGTFPSQFCILLRLPDLAANTRRLANGPDDNVRYRPSSGYLGRLSTSADAGHDVGGHDGGMNGNSKRLIIGWFLVITGAVTALLIVWLGRIVKVPLTTLLTAGAVILALSWLVILTTVPWNLYFAARRAQQEIAVSRDRGIAVRPGYDQEAARISRQMLRFALGAHLGTALAAVAIALASGNKAGYYIAGISLLSTVFRPAAAYFGHLRERIKVLNRESTHPRDDVVTLRHRADTMEQSADELRLQLRNANEELRRTESRLTDEIAHARQVMADDLNRLQDMQAVDRAAARSRDEDLERQIAQMVRRIEATLDGISDHQELLVGLRALVRMVRSGPA